MLEEIEKELNELENKESNIPNMMDLSEYKEKKSDTSEFSKIHFQNENLEKSFEEEKKILDSLRNSKISPLENDLKNLKKDDFKDFPVNDNKLSLITDLKDSEKDLQSENLLNLTEKKIKSLKNEKNNINNLIPKKKNFPKIFNNIIKREKTEVKDKPIREDKILKKILAKTIVKKFGKKSYDGKFLNIDKLNLENFSKKMKMNDFVDFKDNDFLPSVVSYSIIIILIIMIIFQ